MSVRRNLKNVIKNYTPCERLVREATSNDPWGAPASLLANIADLTYNEIEFEQIMTLIWKRLHDHGKNWRHVYKALVLLEYCMKVGHVNVVADLQENIFAVQSLREFTYIDEAGKDCGLNVRERSKAVVALLNDSQRLIDERERAITSRERISGVAVAAQPSIRSSTSPGRPSGAPRGGGVVSGGQIYSRNSDDEVMQAAMQLSLREGPPSALSQMPRDATEEDEQLQLAIALSKSESEAKRQQGGGRGSARGMTVAATQRGNVSPNTARRIQVRSAEEGGDDIWTGAAVVARLPSESSSVGAGDVDDFLDDGVEGTATPPRPRSPADTFGRSDFSAPRSHSHQPPKAQVNNPFY